MSKSSEPVKECQTCWNKGYIFAPCPDYKPGSDFHCAVYHTQICPTCKGKSAPKQNLIISKLDITGGSNVASALSNAASSGSTTATEPSLPVESLEDVLEDVLEPFKLVWDVAAQGPAHQLDDPFKVGDRLYDFQTPPKIALLDYIGRLIEREKQKARIEELETVLKVLNDVGRREPGFYTIEYVHDRLKELREESNT